MLKKKCRCLRAKAAVVAGEGPGDGGKLRSAGFQAGKDAGSY